MVDHITIMLMSGVDDGSVVQLRAETDGRRTDTQWLITVGRKDSNDLCLRNDTFVSRNHANLIWRDGGWYLEDKDSTNGTFLEDASDFFMDERVRGIVPIEPGQLFRVGRTWLRLQVTN
ncbi:MAG: FHA domain-containing protein [Chloroflexota bacterium]